MSQNPDEALRRADHRDLIEAIAHAISFAPTLGRRRRAGDGRFERLAVLVAAEQIADHLARSRFVVMQRPPAAPHDASRFMPQPDLF